MGPDSYLEWRNAWVFGNDHDPVMLQELPRVNIHWPPVPDQQVGPVFLISPTQRSGSTHVHELLALHPGLEALSAKENVPKEYFLHTYGEALQAYVERTTATWDTWIPQPEDKKAMAQRMFAAIGKGMLNELFRERPPERPLLRAPDSRNIRFLFNLFPDATVILLFRDGRDTCSSFMNSWGTGSVFADFARRWAGRVEEMLSFEEEARAAGYGDRVLRLHYEECVKHPEQAIREILPAIQLNENEYPFHEMSSLPVLGSSEAPEVHWEPVEKPEGFNPLGRWKKWPDAAKKEFDDLAGETMRRLGYTS